MAATRESIERALRAMKGGENSLDLTPAEKTVASDHLFAVGVRGWTNGVDSGDRAAEREREAWVFSSFQDYHREFNHVVIDAPNAAITWRMTGRVADTGADYALDGASVFKFDEESRIEEFWVFFGNPPEAAPAE